MSKNHLSPKQGIYEILRRNLTEEHIGKNLANELIFYVKTYKSTYHKKICREQKCWECEIWKKSENGCTDCNKIRS